MQSSTKKMIHEASLRRFLTFLHGYIYLRWTKQYIKLLLRLLPLGSPRFKKWFSDRYHGKVLTHEQVKAIVSTNRKIPWRDLEQIIPYPIARGLVINGPPDIAIYECACRHARTNPCQPTQVCMVIGQPFVDFTIEHNPRSSRRISQAEALKLLQKEYELGHLHSAWFKDACFGRFYAICNCCKCCCGGIEAMTKYDMPMMAPSGYIARVDKKLCTTCSICVEACPFNALSIDETVIIDWDKCMGCGVCTGKCLNQAMSLVRDEGKGLPFDIRLLGD